MEKVTISLVSYLNTIPFNHGIAQADLSSEDVEISRDYPAECARKLLEGEVDLGLVPVAIIPKLKESHIITDYCIGAIGKVKSVLLLSDVPLEKIENIYLDYQSRTSVALCQLLCKEHWKIQPNFLDAELDYEKKIKGNTAGVVIGDRTFFLEKKYAYEFDLSEEWQKMTDLPFVFAAWVSNKKLPATFVKKFNAALKNGVDQLPELLANTEEQSISKAELKAYLTKYIKFELDDEKRKGLDLFLKKLEDLPLH